MSEFLEGVLDPGPASVAGSGGTPVVFTPNGHGESPGERLTYAEAREAPCLSCQTSPCCTHLLLGDFQLETILDVDYALYLLNFDGIYLGLGQDHKLDVYLYQPCTYLDSGNGLCTVHSTPVQPAVCVQYKSHNCGYRHRMTVQVDPVRPVMDRARMAWLADQLVFADDRRVVGGPPWDQVLAAFASIPMQRRPLRPPDPDPVREEWRSIVLSRKTGPETDNPVHRFDDPEVSNPCQGCGAWCCKRLVFNRGLPSDASQLDFLRYCLGFPGVELGVAADAWAVIVHTTCRHLEADRCSVYGTDQRPLKCGYYDALSCTYRGHFGTPRPDDIVRVTREQFGVVADSILFDDLGKITAIPPTDVLRNRLEDAERARAT